MARAFSSALQCVCDGSDLPDFACIYQLPPGWRHRLLPPGRTLQLYLAQVANGNVACDAVRHLAGEDFSDSAWCQARSRLATEWIDQANAHVVEAALKQLDEQAAQVAPRWHGHRVFILDGTSDVMPDTKVLRKHYGVPPQARKGLGDPTSHLLLCVDHRSGLITQCIDGPICRSDLADTPQVHGPEQAGDVVLGDGYFSNYAHMALILQAQKHFVLPAHHKRIIDFRPGREHVDPRKAQQGDADKPRSVFVRRLGKDDQIVEYLKPGRKPKWLSDQKWEAMPASIKVREIRQTVYRKGFRPIKVTIVTSLLEEKEYPADELRVLRMTRWWIEINIRHLKITLGMQMLKCKTVEGVKKERKIFILVYNLIHLLMIRATRAQKVNVRRISFADALAWLRLAQTSDDLPELLVNPPRPGRCQPRRLKRSPAKYPCMTQPRSKYKSQLRTRQADTA